jgi:hypothetical protein
VVFFVSLATSLGAAEGLAWLAYVAPFTPFMLLLEPAGQILSPAALAALALFMGATALACLLAVSGVTLSPRPLLAMRRLNATPAK